MTASCLGSKADNDLIYWLEPYPYVVFSPRQKIYTSAFAIELREIYGI